MPNTNHPDLQELARQSMLEHGFEPEFPPQVQEQLDQLNSHPPQVAQSADVGTTNLQVFQSTYV